MAYLTLFYALISVTVFYTEVVDSLIRGFEDHLPCDNLVLEINSSRYAYNVTVHEVNFHVVRAILTLPITSENTVTYWQKLLERLSFFQPILEKYVRNEAAQHNCLMAIEVIFTTKEFAYYQYDSGK